MIKNYLLLQINDALFPIGAYSHSYGLETYIQKNLVYDEKTSAAFIKNYLYESFCYSDLLTAKLCHEYAASENAEDILRINALVTASKTPYELRNASKKLASRFIKTVSLFETEYETDIFERCIKQSEDLNYAVVYGVFCAAAGIEFRAAAQNYIYAQTSAMATNCVKAIPLSQSAGQRILFDTHKYFDEIIELVLKAGEDELCMGTPGFELRSMQHEALYSRIYMS